MYRPPFSVLALTRNYGSRHVAAYRRVVVVAVVVVT